MVLRSALKAAVEHMHLVDDVDLPSGGLAHSYAADNSLTNIFNARATCGVQLVHIGIVPWAIAWHSSQVPSGSMVGPLFAH